MRSSYRPGKLTPRVTSAYEALLAIRNGQSVFVGSGAGEPLELTRALAEMAERFWDVEVIHLATTAHGFVLARPDLNKHFRYNTFCVGRGISQVLTSGIPDHTPLEIGELPKAIRRGLVKVDVALVQVSPPDDLGLCSLGVSVDVTRAAVEAADVVIAEVNENMPVTFGDSLVPYNDFDFVVEADHPLIEVPPTPVDAVSLSVGKHVASLIQDGTTLYFDRGPMCSAAMRYLGRRVDLGLHTIFLTDDIMRLISTRAVTNRNKKLRKGRTVASLAVGTRDLYRQIDGNPYVELLPIDVVTDPDEIQNDDCFVSIHDVEAVELNGVAWIYEEEGHGIGGAPLGGEILAGARRSPRGFSIMALRSTTEDGQRSAIVARSEGRGAHYDRTVVDCVVTEYGIAQLYGLPARDRAMALISIAHPRFRARLLEEAKAAHYVDATQVIPPEIGCIYPSHLEFSHTFDDGLEIFFRPVKPSDARGFQRLFYSLTPEMVRLRYHGAIKALSNETAQQITTVDYSQDIAIVGVVGGSKHPQLVAEGRYLYLPESNMGEFNIVVHKDYQRRGIGKFLANYLKKIAYSRGLSGIVAEVIQRNEPTQALLRKAWPTAQPYYESGYCTFTLRFPDEDVKNPKESIIMYSGKFGDFEYGSDNPFIPGRAVKAVQLIEKQGHLSEPWMRVEEPTPITRQTLLETHSPQYIEVLERANDGVWDDRYADFGLGSIECPVFVGLFDYILTYTSATVGGVERILNDNANIVFNPLGGFHHASNASAAGFCYVNDINIAISMLLAKGVRVAHIDIDAHHGNGVQDAFYEDDRVLTISLHQSGKTLYPWTGFENEIGENIGRGYNINVPLPVGTDDECFEMVFDDLITDAVTRFNPAVVICTIGADTHRNDPMANLSLTNNGMVGAIKRIRDYSKHLLLLGGGGYDVKTTAAAWCRMWAAANRIDDLPDYLLAVGGSFMSSEGMGAEIVDMAYRVSGSVKKEMIAELDRISAFHRKNTLPLIR